MVDIFTSNKIDFKTKAITRNKEGHYVILKGSPQEVITLVSMYAPNTGAPKYIRKIWEDFKKEIDSSTVIVGDFNTPLSTTDISSKQRVNKNSVALNDTLDQIDLVNICRTFHLKETKYEFFPNAQRQFSTLNHMIGHKTSLNKFKKIEIIYSIFSDHNGLKLETNPRNKFKNIQMHGD